MDTSQYLEIFLDETQEHLQSLNTQVLNLEQDPSDHSTVDEIFRAAHSLKGMAGTMGYKRMQAVTHEMENVFSEVRKGTIKVNADIVDVLFKSLDAIEEYRTTIQETADEGKNENQELIASLKKILSNSVSDGAEASGEAASLEAQGPEAGTKEGAPWLNITLYEEQRKAFEEVYASDLSVFGFLVKIDPNCVLKAARAFLVFKAIENHGELVASDPPVQDIEDEKFGNQFVLLCTSNATLDEVLAEIRNVSEIELAEGGVVERGQLFGEEEKEDQKSEHEEPSKTNALEPTEAKGKSGGQSKQPSGKKQEAKGKPVVSRTVRVDLDKLDVLMNLVSELIIAKNSLVSASAVESGANNSVNEQIEYLESVTTNLHESVMKVRMVPIESVVSKFPRMIRDLSKSLNKKMDLYMSGEETELDRTVVEEIGDPLMHLLRNSADHGLESAEQRAQRGKPEVGSIFLTAYQDGNNVVIEVGDDGNGIDSEAVKNKAIERGLITAEQAEYMDEKEITNLLFAPGFSTAKVITDVSGRGVGLDVVKSKIEALSGDVEVKTELGVGSTFIIRLPLTLAIIQALMVVIGGEKYAISLGSIQTIEDINPKDIGLVQGKEVIQLRGSVVPVVRLNEILDIESQNGPDDNLVVVIVKKGDKFAGLVVDDLMGQQEIVIKSLGQYINKNKVISGATILGDGEVALILDANTLT